LEKKYKTIKFNDIKILKCLSLTNRIIVKDNYFETKENFLRTLRELTEKTSGKCTDNSEISLELPNGIKMKFKGTGGCKAALSLLTKLCGTCFA
jgi:hypothetical protein